MSVPDRLGRYAVRRRLGAGAFATVWLAHDDQLDSPVAIKVLADNWSADHDVRRRFVEEGRFLRRVESRHVVSVFDAGELEDGRPYLVMTLADGGTLAERLESGEDISHGDAVRIVAQVASGLQALHEGGVLHRDIKPANVLFRTGPDGLRAVVGDLGLGKAVDMSSRLTMIGGTPSYVSPEQARGEHLDARTDQYSLAVLAYRLLAGQPPYAHLSLVSAISPPPPATMAGIDARLEAVVRRGLAVDREDRWPSVVAFAEALEEALLVAEPGVAVGMNVPLELAVDDRTQLAATGRVVSQEVTAPRPQRWRGGMVAAVVALVVGVLGGFVWSSGGSGNFTIVDDSGTLSLEVPQSWRAQVSTSAWEPPDADADFPAVSVGSGAGWREAGSAESGVFAALLPLDQLTESLPTHPECGAVEPAIYDTATSGGAGDAARTVWSTDCPGVLVERIEQVATNRMLWVQVRADNRDIADDVLQSINVSGL